MYSSTLSLTSALDGGGWSTRHPRPLYPRYVLYRRLCGLHGLSGRVRKISLPLRFDPRTVQPVASRYTDWAILAHRPGTNRIGEVSPRAGLDLLGNRQISAPVGSRPAVLRYPVRILVTVSYTSDFLALSGTAEHLQIVAIPGDPFHTIPSTVGPPKAQVAATFVNGIVMKNKHTETLKTFIN